MSGGTNSGATGGVVVGVDIGGTKVLAGVVDADGRVGRNGPSGSPQAAGS